MALWPHLCRYYVWGAPQLVVAVSLAWCADSYNPLPNRLWSLRAVGSNKEEGGRWMGLLSRPVRWRRSRCQLSHRGKVNSTESRKVFFRATELMNSGPSRSVVVYGGLSCVNKQSTQSVSSQLNTYNCYWIQAKELGISQVVSFIVLLSWESTIEII